MMPTVRLGSASIHCQIASSSAWPSMFIQFNSFGLFNLTSNTPGAGCESTQYFEGGCGFSKDWEAMAFGVFGRAWTSEYNYLELMSFALMVQLQSGSQRFLHCIIICSA